MREQRQQAPAKNGDDVQFIASKASGDVLWNFGSFELPIGKTQSDDSDPWQPFLSAESKFEPQEPLEIPALVPSNNNLEKAAPNELNTLQPYDFWQPFSNTDDTLPEQGGTSINSADQFHYEIPLPQTGLRTSPFIFEFRKPTREEIAARRARNLLALMNDVCSEKQRTVLTVFFTEVFETYPHASTFRRLSDLVLNHIPAQVIVQVCRFRFCWEERPEWHSIRYKGKFHASNQKISWLRAWRWVELCGGSDPTDYIEDEWQSLWAALPWGDPAYDYFADFIEQKLSAYANGVWEPPISIRSKRATAIQNLGFGETYLKSRTGHLVKDFCGPPYEYKPKPEFSNEDHAD